MSFLSTKRTLGFKLESSAYTAETLAATDFDVSAENITYDPEIEQLARKIARGHMSQDISISGKRRVKIAFRVGIHAGAAAATAPKYGKCLKACAMKETVHSTTGVSYVPHSGYTNVPATIEVVEKDEGASPAQVVIKARGCMGTAKIVMDSVGQPVFIDFEFTGVLVSITDRAFGSILTPTGFDTVLPDAVLSATLTAFGEVQRANKITIDLGNTVEVYSDPSKAEGLQGAHVTARTPTINLDPDLELIATQGDMARWTGNATGAFLMTVGSSIKMSAPCIQLQTGFKPGDREGHVVNNKTFILTGNAGDDEFKFLQGAE